MELTFSELRTKEVVNTQDGRKLGKVCDMVFCYPENRWLGIVAPNGHGFGFKKNGLFIELRNIVKIGEDVILVNVGLPRKRGGKRGESAHGGMDSGMNAPPPPSGMPYGEMPRRSFEEYE